ncbi:MAG TPA: glycosyltransferase [Vicinamibacterales bacterium]|nr:glycosyltransferase [Vicinamibacterales bacterium]
MPRTNADRDVGVQVSGASFSGGEAVWHYLYRQVVFLEPARLAPPPAWLEHVPFALWIIDALRPAVVVELGTQSGNSYAAFCQAVKELRLPAACYAVDTWRGDPHAGFYGEEVFEEWTSYHDRHFSAFSRIIRSTFEDAVQQFSDNSIDLLHIDGCHTYEAVSNDFARWRPKLSRRGVVLFHDTNVRERDFGAWRLWEELAGEYPSFQFLHGHGLGVLGVGSELPEPVRWLLSCGSAGEESALVRQFFASLGRAVLARFLAEQAERSYRAELDSLKQNVRALEVERNAAAEQLREFGEAARVLREERDELKGRVAALVAEMQAASAARREMEVRYQAATTRIDVLTGEVDALQAALAARSEQIAVLRDAAEAQRVRADAACADAVSLKVELEAERSARASLQAMLDGEREKARVAIDDLSAEVEALRARLAERETAVAGLQQQNRHLRSRLEETEASLAATAAEQDTLRARVEQLSEDLGARSDRLAQLEQQAHEEREQRTRLEAARQELTSRLESALAADSGRALALRSLRSSMARLQATRSQRVARGYRAVRVVLHALGLLPLRLTRASVWSLLSFCRRPSRFRHAYLVALSGLLDETFYRHRYPDVASSRLHPLVHFVLFGARERRDPHPLFDASWYLAANPDVAASGLNPLVHYWLHGAAEGRDPHPLFSAAHYRQGIGAESLVYANPLLDYVTLGRYECRATHPLFDPLFYLETNPDLARAGLDPLEHFLLHGARERRNPHPLFDVRYYLEQNPDVAATGVNPLFHYVLQGWRESRNPHPMFDVSYYLATNPHVRESGAEPLSHFLASGAAERRNPHPMFDVNKYIDGNPDVAMTAVNPLVYHVLYRERGALPCPSHREATSPLEMAADPSAPADASAEPPRGPHVVAHLDHPVPGSRVGGTICVQGWAFSPNGIRRVVAVIDGIGARDLHHGQPRPDVAAAHQNQPGSANSGFRAFLDLAPLADGPHRLTVRVVETTGGTADLVTDFVLDRDCVDPFSGVPDINSQYRAWLQQHAPTRERLRGLAGAVARLQYRPLFSILMPVYNTQPDVLEAAIGSVIDQIYPEWELCIVDDGSTQEDTKCILDRFSRTDRRIRVQRLPTNTGIACATQAALEMAHGDFIGLLDHDDLLWPNALYECAKLLNKHPEADLIYSDEDKIAPDGSHYDPFFKPDWSPDLLLSMMYIGHFAVYRRLLVCRLGGFRPEVNGSQDYDLALRVAERTERIFHIPTVLYSWRSVAGSAAAQADAKPYALAAARLALEQALQRRRLDASVQEGLGPGRWRIRYRIHAEPEVALLMPTGGRADLLNEALRSILERTRYRWYRIWVIDNSHSDEVERLVRSLAADSACRVAYLRFPDRRFNFSAMINWAVSVTKGSYLCILNDDISVVDSEWLEAMLEHAQRPEVGVVGCKLLYPTERVQHAGVVMGVYENSGHLFKGYPATHPGYFGLAGVVRNCSAVTFACAMIRRSVFDELGGLDAEHLPVAFNDVDFCLRAWRRGYRVLYTPHAVLYHHESATKTAIFGEGEVTFMQEVWREFIDQDPFYNRNLTRRREDCSLRVVDSGTDW